MGRPKKKYSALILDEAITVASQEGLKRAEELTGVNKETIKQEARARRIGDSKLVWAEKRRGAASKYTLQQKIACVKLAMELSKYNGRRKAFVIAGKRMGVNGRSIEMQAVRGLIPGVSL